MTSKFKGTGVALVTPFDNLGNVDYQALSRLTEHLVSGKLEYLVALGTTGESVTLTKDEKKKVVEEIKKVNAGRVPVVIGIGGNSTLEVIETIENTDFNGIDAILSVSPYYNKPTQEGIYQHYKAISLKSPVPIILYNVPGRTSSNMLPETTLRLARDFKNIIAIKEASGNLEQVMKIINRKPKNFMVISGDDALTLPMIAAGADGVISVVANGFPFEFSEMVRYCLKGDFEKARTFHYNLLDIIENLFVEGNPGGIKAVLKLLGITEDYLRLPLVNISDTTFQKLKELVNKKAVLSF